MSDTQTVAPDTDPVTPADVMNYARIEVADETTLVRQLIKAATYDCEQALTWRQFVTATWTRTWDRFPGPGAFFSEIELPYPPLQSVTTVKYYDSAGTQQTLATTEYDVDALSEPGRIAPAFGKTWPATRNQINAVEITFVAGYGVREVVPEGIKLAISALVAFWYEHREDAEKRMPPHIERMLAPYSVKWSA